MKAAGHRRERASSAGTSSWPCGARGWTSPRSTSTPRRTRWLAGVRGAGVVFHLAGVNRPEHESEFDAGNVGSLDALFAALDAARRGRPAGGAAADRALLVDPGRRSTTPTAAPSGPRSRRSRRMPPAPARRPSIYRLPGVFGKWCRPNYNSVVATFCHNIARDLPIAISDPARVVELVHVDDVVAQFMTHLDGQAAGVTRGEVRPVFTITLGELADRIRGFRAMRDTLEVADASDPFTRRLLGTYTLVPAARRSRLPARAAHRRPRHAGRAAEVAALRADLRLADAARASPGATTTTTSRSRSSACSRARPSSGSGRSWATRSPSTGCRGRTSRWWTSRRA